MQKTLILLLFYFVTSIGLVPVILGFTSENKELNVVTHLDLNRFQGTWYEIGHNPWFPEKDCFAMIAHYKLTEDSQIEVTNICRKKGFDEEISKVSGKAWLVSPKINSKW